MNFCNERTRTVFLFTSLYFIMKLYQSSIGVVQTAYKWTRKENFENFFRLYYYYDAAADAAGISIHFQTLGKKIDIFRIKSPKEKNHTHSRLTDWLTDSRGCTLLLYEEVFSQIFFLTQFLLVARFLCKAEKNDEFTPCRRNIQKSFILFFVGLSVCLFSRAPLLKALNSP